MTKFTVPAKYIVALSNSVSGDPLRPNLGGIFIEHGHMVATNGHILMTISIEEDSIDGQPIILKMDTKEKVFKTKTRGELIVKGDTETKIASFYDSGTERQVGICLFEVIDEVFPDWKVIIHNAEKTAKLENVMFDGNYISNFVTASKELGRNGAIQFDFTERFGVIKVSIGVDGFKGLLMPMLRMEQTRKGRRRNSKPTASN